MADLFDIPTQHPVIPCTTEEQIDWIRLSRSENVGPVTFNQLLQRYRTPAKALAAIPTLARKGGSKQAIRICDPELAAQEREAAVNFGAEFVPKGAPEYPPLLTQTHSAPPFLWVKGNLQLLQRNCIAIVGARNASAAGVRFAGHIAGELARHDYCVVSGLARGIDAAAHESTLNANGMTVGVVAGGVDVIWPPETQSIAERVWKQGVSVSEMPMGEKPRNRHFPRRNRIISGLSQGIILVEAAQKSGSLITAKYALEQGREILAVPGSPLDGRAAGCNDLIRKGATLIRDIDDILEALTHWSGPPECLSEPDKVSDALTKPPTEDEIAHARKTILELLSPTPTLLDDIIVQSGTSVPIVQSVLLELDLAGRLERHTGGYISLTEAWQS